MTIIVILVQFLVTNVVVIIVFEVVHTCGEFNIIRKSIPCIHNSMTEKVTSLLTDESRLSEVESGGCRVIWSEFMSQPCSVVVISPSNFEEGRDWKIINLM